MSGVWSRRRRLRGGDAAADSDPAGLEWREERLIGVTANV
jgi:hypothetical protein